MLTRKHFQAIADTIRDCEPDTRPHDSEKFARDVGAERMREAMAKDFARLCARFNPNFDRGRFLRACGIEE